MIQWTDAQREFLFLNWRRMHDGELAEALSRIGPPRTDEAVADRRRLLGLKRPTGFQQGPIVTRSTNRPEDNPWPALKGPAAEREKRYLRLMFEGMAEEQRPLASRALAQQEVA